MSTSPSQDVLFHQFEEFRKLHYPGEQRGVAFARFMTSIALRRYPLGLTDSEPGFTEGSRDGGIDGFHVILNNTESISSETRGLTSSRAPSGVQERVPFDLVILQSKMDTGGWDGLALPRLREVLELIFMRNGNERELRDYPLRDEVVRQVLAFRQFQKKLIGLDPVRKVTVLVMQPVVPQAIKPDAKRAAKSLEKLLRDCFPAGTQVEVRLCDVNAIEEMRTEQVEFKGTLRYSTSPTGLSQGKSEAWLGVVSVGEFVKFISRDTGVLRDEFFASNVRDFAGTKSSVNAAIQSSLQNDSSTAFWWMNNGVTVLADEARQQTDNVWSLINPQIVNGLQTSHVIFETSRAKQITKKRARENLVIRVIAEQDPQVREAIISGTNNQAAVSQVQLFANDEFQVQLEQYLLTKGWFYERRRWQYRNQKVSRSRIRTLTQVTQFVEAAVLLRPDLARARPMDQLKTKKGYIEVFSSSVPMPAYSAAIGLAAKVEQYLSSDAARSVTDDATNDRFYLLTGVALRTLAISERQDFSAKRLAEIDQERICDIEELHYRLADFSVGAQDKKARDSLFKKSAFALEWVNEVLRME